MAKISLDEQILALGFSDKKHAMELSNSVDIKYFTKNYQWLFDVLMHYFQDPNIKEIPTYNMVSEYLGADAKDTSCMDTFNRVKEIKIDPTEFKWILGKLRVRYNNKLQGDLKNTLSDFWSQQSPGPERVEEVNKTLKEVVTKIDAINRRSVYKEGTLKDSAQDRIKRYEYIKAHPEAARGILTGLSTLDAITNGLHPGELIIIAGDTGTGKSILLHNIAINAYLGKNDPFDSSKKLDDSGSNILFFSLEMPKETIERRIDACVSGVYSNHIRDGKLTEEDEFKYLRGLRFQERYNKQFHIVDMPRNVTSREIELKYLEVFESGFEPDLLVVDYLGIMSPNETTGSDWQDLGKISAELHEIGRVYEITVLTASQVNKTKDGQESYDTNRLSRSGMVPTNANIIMQIACRPDEDLRTDMIIHITKMRDGEKGHFSLSKDFGKMKVIDIVDESFTDEDDDDF